MTRDELVRRLVVNEISDDFENIDQVILRRVAETGIKCGLTIERSEVVAALESLIADGLATAHILPEPGEVPGMPPVNEIEENFKTYFHITKKGMAVHLSDDTWCPLDDEENLRPDWRLSASDA